jgi:hypothetical protein
MSEVFFTAGVIGEAGIKFQMEFPLLCRKGVVLGQEKGGSPTPKRSATRFLSYPKFSLSEKVLVDAAT